MRQHTQISGRCWSMDMINVQGIRGYEGPGVLVKSMMSVTLPADTKQQQVLGTRAYTDWLVSAVGEISLCQHLAPCAKAGPLTLLFFPHSIKMQSVWLIVVSCALRQDHHQLFRSFTWCWTPITMKVNKMPICLDVYSLLTWGADKCAHQRLYWHFVIKLILLSIYFLPPKCHSVTSS